MSHYMQKDWRGELAHRMTWREMEQYRKERIAFAKKQEEKKNATIQS